MVRTLSVFGAFLLLTLTATAQPRPTSQQDSVALPLTTDAQPWSNPHQDSAASRFIRLLIDNRDDEAWELMAPQLREKISRDEYSQLASGLRNIASSLGREIEPFAQSIQASPPYLVYQYVYRFRADVSSVPAVLIDISFLDTVGTDIVGFYIKVGGSPSVPDGGMIPTSRGGEVMIDSAQVWIVGGDSLRINDLSLISFNDGTAMLAIKAFHTIPDTMSQEQARTIAIPIARYANEHGLLDKARKRARALGMDEKIIESIGVALVVPGTGRGYRVIVEPDQYGRK